MIPKDRILDKLDSFLKGNDYAGAKRLLQYWLTEAQQQRDLRGMILLHNELMGLCRKLGEKDEALRHAQEALDKVGEGNLGDTVGGATTFLNSATVCKAFGMAKEALDLFEMAREIYERELPPDDDRLAGLYNNMGLALVDLERFDEADCLYQKALSVLEGLCEKEPEMAITYLNMATAAETERGPEAAKDTIATLCKKAKECLEIGSERKDGGYAFVCEKCASVFGYYGDEDYAAALSARCRRIYEGT